MPPLVVIENTVVDQWRYQYPKFDTSQHWAKVPSKELSDTLAEQFKDRLKD